MTPAPVDGAIAPLRPSVRVTPVRLLPPAQQGEVGSATWFHPTYLASKWWSRGSAPTPLLVGTPFSSSPPSQGFPSSVR